MIEIVKGAIFLKKDIFCFLLNCQEAGTIYTHHQKTVIVDADAGQHKRKIIAFIGGLDLCLGRYDTPTHSLFRTLQTTHKDDFHNPNYEVSHPFFIFIISLKSLSSDKIWSENIL
jgi:hypothetical protein